MNKNIGLFIVFVFFFNAFAEEPAKTRIAIIDLGAQGVSQSEALSVTDFLQQDMMNSGRYILVERKKIEQVLKEQKFQLSGCTTTECAVEIGKILNVEKMIMGSVNHLGEKYFINIRMVEVETGKIVRADEVKCDSIDKLREVTKVLALKISGAKNILSETTYINIINDIYRKTINGIYNAMTERDATPEEISKWSQFLNDGNSKEEIENTLKSSQECKDIKEKLTDKLKEIKIKKAKNTTTGPIVAGVIGAVLAVDGGINMFSQKSSEQTLGYMLTIGGVGLIVFSVIAIVEAPNMDKQIKDAEDKIKLLSLDYKPENNMLCLTFKF
ncbi:MAG: hypothetical protein A2231_05795 [Candidatus Firestonebacteria bacterium RIFOXYA2_FULL_40_8]|nr:MAG: hypothetical protein A2231_05795 [Candidatus Firestonebacteria bacterium RIFOXYA2_FULL_40_8]